METVVSTDIGYQQYAQTGRQYFTPGKRVPVFNQSRMLEMNWPTDFVVKVGIPVVDNLGGLKHVRRYTLGENLICNQEIPAPIVTATTHVAINSGTGTINGAYDIKETDTVNNNGNLERNTGFETVSV